MSKLDDVLSKVAEPGISWAHDQLDGTSFIKDELENIDELVKESKRDIKKLILNEFKAAEYDPWAFAERIEKL